MQFIVSRDNEQFGPYTLEQLHQYVNEGSIYPHDLVFDGQNWVNVSQIITPQQQPQITSFAVPQITQHPKAQRVQQGPNLGNVVGPMFNSQKWIRFMSVLGFIVGAFESILVIITIFKGLGIAVFFANLLNVVISFYAASLLWKYANSINVLRGAFQINNLKNSIELQARFWTFVGILTLIIVIIMSLILILIVAGIGNWPAIYQNFPVEIN